jgi:hypothetical protein
LLNDFPTNDIPALKTLIGFCEDHWGVKSEVSFQYSMLLWLSWQIKSRFYYCCNFYTSGLTLGAFPVLAFTSICAI